MLLVALAGPGRGQAAELHRLRSELARARAALRAVTEQVSGATADHHRPGPAGAASLDAAGSRVRAAEAALDRAVADVERSGLLAGLFQQVRTLVLPPAGGAEAGTLRAPLRGLITSGFGPRRVPSWGRPFLHEGIDIFAFPGTPVRAAAGGTVVLAGSIPTAGLTVTVDHGSGRGQRLHTVYSHLSVIGVRAGDRVQVGDVLGEVGSTGSHSFGPHLHFEVLLEGQAVDPRAWL